ncbi:pre-rRNA-processing protein esf1, partial [Podila humilis]
PEKGAIRSVKIYPSEFGKERLEREEREGPPAEIFKKNNSSKKDSEDSDDDSDDEEVTQESLIKKQTEDDDTETVDSEALRQYQLDRLKYYYAVVDCDSVETAKAICEACDGAEYESSANFFDLRFIPDGMAFDGDTPRDESFGAPENYKPNDFTTQAFQHSNVKLTWDEDDADRIKVTRHKFSKQDLDDMDFNAYLASSDEEDSQDEDDIETTRRKYRALLAGGNKDSDDSDAGSSDDDKNQEMEITFAPGLSEAAAEMLEAKKQREQPVVEETSIDSYKRKEKLRKQRRKETRAAKVKANKGSDASDSGGDSDADMQGGEALFSDDEDERLMNDSYFAEEFAGGDMTVSGKNKKDDKKKKNKKQQRTKEERLEDNRKKAELELLMEDNRESNQHFNMKEIQKAEKKKKGKKGKKGGDGNKDAGEDLQDDFKIDVQDPRFSALHESHHFALDPTNPNFKKTKAMSELMEERQKRTAQAFDENEKKLKQKQKQNNNANTKNNKDTNNKTKGKKDNNDGHAVKKPTGLFEDPSLSLLVDTVKRKSAMATEDARNGKRSKKN